LEAPDEAHAAIASGSSVIIATAPALARIFDAALDDAGSNWLRVTTGPPGQEKRKACTSHV
jgi:hypothetical protein